ncbi:hypothetical protein IKE82_01525 [Candidatus Saccharibacteria bacterium]|nr:hypothetical protein [Candidatus Saccharibacteria bacterium]
MNNQLKPQKTISPIILLIVTLQIIFIVVVIAVIINQTSQNHEITTRDSRPRITIDDLSSSINLPSDYTKDISLSLTSAMELNNTKLPLDSSDAIIRDGSLTLREFSEQQFNALSFIIDIPDLEQSYQIYYKYPITTDTTTTPYFNNPRAVLCLDDPTTIIYANFDCRSSYPDDTRQRIVQDYFNFLTFNDFTASISDQNRSIINLTPAADSVNIDSESYITSTKSTIKTLGISPDLFEYRILRN